MTSRPWPGGALLASLLLGACGLPGEDPAPATAKTGASTNETPVTEPAPKTAPTAPVISAPADAPAAETPAEETPPGKSAGGGEAAPRLAMRSVKKLAPPDPRRLIGMGQEDVAGLLGPPAFERKDDPALVWQYRSAACILDVFLYLDGAAYSVAHFEVRGPSVVEVDRKACFLGLLRDRAKPG